jgi:hypothetical protein
MDASGALLLAAGLGGSAAVIAGGVSLYLFLEARVSDRIARWRAQTGRAPHQAR